MTQNETNELLIRLDLNAECDGAGAADAADPPIATAATVSGRGPPSPATAGCGPPTAAAAGGRPPHRHNAAGQCWDQWR